MKSAIQAEGTCVSLIVVEQGALWPTHLDTGQLVMIAQQPAESPGSLAGRLSRRLAGVQKHDVYSRVAVLSVGADVSEPSAEARRSMACTLAQRLTPSTPEAESRLLLMAPSTASPALRHQLMLLTGALCEQLSGVAEVVLRFGEGSPASGAHPVAPVRDAVARIDDPLTDDRPSQPAVA